MSPAPVETRGPLAERATQTALVIDPRWTAAVSGWLTAHKTYPEEARRRGEEGHVSIRFTVDRFGRVEDAAIVTGSGSTILDEGALSLLRRATLPEFPAGMTQARITITTTVRYSLR